MTVTSSINLGTGFGPVHFQGKRPTCLAFALSDLNRHAHNIDEPLSAEYLYRSAARQMPGWRPDGGLDLQSALNAVSNPGQPRATAYPYVQTEPVEMPPLLKPIPSMPPGFGDLFASTFQAGSPTTQAVLTSILGGTVVGLAIAVTDSFYYPIGGVIADSSSVVGSMLHAVVATGLGTDTTTNLPYVRIRNTWGPTWGSAGNAWLPFSYLDQHLVQVFKI